MEPGGHPITEQPSLRASVVGVVGRKTVQNQQAGLGQVEHLPAELEKPSGLANPRAACRSQQTTPGIGQATADADSKPFVGRL